MYRGICCKDSQFDAGESILTAIVTGILGDVSQNNYFHFPHMKKKARKSTDSALWVKENLQQWKKDVRAYKRCGKAEDLHKLRLDCKRLQAYVYFLKLVAPDRVKRKEWKAWQNLYELSGKIRDHQQHHDLLIRMQFPEVADALFHPRLTDSMHKQWKKAYRKSSPSINKGYRKLIRIAGNRKITKGMNKAIVHGWKELEDMLTHDNSQFELHDLRKMIKRALFARQFLTDNKYKQPKKLITYCKRLEEILGKWHDQEKLEKWMTANGSGLSGRTAQHICDLSRAQRHTYIVDLERILAEFRL